MKNTLLLFLLLATTFVTCDIYSQDDYEEFYVIESYIVANRNLSQVRVSTTAPAFEFYSFENTAISNANVEVRLLNQNGTGIEQTFSFSMQSPGIYIPDINHSVLPERTYQLVASIPNGSVTDQVSATTIVPGAFSVISGIQDTLVYQSSDQLEVTLSESSYPGRQNVLVFSTISENPIPANLTPLYLDFYENEDEADENGDPRNDLLVEFSNTSSGLLNEGNFEQHPDGSVTISYPWIAVAFFEENKIVATTVDDNIYDYIRSSSVQLGGSTLSPGEIQNVISHVEGGLGIFGAMASDTIPTFIKRPTGF